MVEDAFLFDSIMDKYSSKFNVNELYTPIFIVLIMWYLLTTSSALNKNLCTNCSQPIVQAPPPPAPPRQQWPPHYAPYGASPYASIGPYNPY